MGVTQQFTIVLFTLPDGKLVLQRRTDDAPYAPGKLGIFGGWVEEGETPDQCIEREITEETSLNVRDLVIKKTKEFTLPANDDFPGDRHFHMYTAEVRTPDFEVYEGQGSEVFSLEQLRGRSDLNGSADYVFKHIL